MSLRARLVLIVVVSGVALCAALAAIFGLVTASNDARLEAAESAGQGVAEALAEALKDEGASLRDAPKHKTLARVATDALAGAPRAVGGYCTREGVVVQLRARANRDAKNAHLPESQRSSVERACAAAAAGPRRFNLANAETHIVVLAPVPGGSAFVFYSIRGVRSLPTSLQIEVLVLALATIVLMIVVLDALMALRRGAAQLHDALGALSKDLDAEVKEPRAAELAAIARGLAAMARSLSEARAREQSLEKSLAHEQRLAGLGRLAAGVAHEIRNPLAGMKLRLDLMVDDAALSDEARTDVRACLSEVGRLDRVVQSLLGVARKGEPWVGVALHELVDERIALLDGKAIRTGEGHTRTDRDGLGRVLDNLLRNANEADSEGPVRAVITTDPDGATHIRIEDDGPGVPESRQGELFEPFFTTKAGGTGLGLWMSRVLVEALGGRLRYTREGGCTAFVVDLPPPGLG